MEFSILELPIIGLILGVLIYLYQRHEYTAKKKVFDNPSSSPTYEEITPIKKELAKSFYNRYSASKLTAYGVLFLTILIILTGAYIFLNASTIARADTASVPIGSDRWLQVQDSIANKYFIIYCEDHKIGRDTMTRGYYYNLMVQIKQQYKGDIDKEIVEVFEKEKQPLENGNPSSSLLNLIASMTIRVMISFFVFYLVQILKLYRYNLKVSDFYINKYDAILSYEEMKLPFE